MNQTVTSDCAAMANDFQPIARHFAAWAGVLACLVPLSGHSQSLAEALDTTNLVWTTGGDVPWFGQADFTHDGTDAARSGVVTSNQTSWLETTIMGPATLHYYMGIDPDESLPGLSISYNGDDSEQYAIPIRPLPYWMEPVTDLAAGPQTIRWRVTSSYSAINVGYVVLDEFEVLPPRPLAFTYLSVNQEIYSRETAYFGAYAIGTPPLQYQWRKAGLDIPNATNAYFEIINAITNDSGLYSVVVSNSQGFILSSNATLTVLPPAPPFFTYAPSDTTGYVGQTVYLQASVSGSPPFNYHWRKDGTNLTENSAVPFWGSISLTLLSLSETAAGSYSVVVTNAYGSAESSSAVLTVIPSVAPVITKHPRSLEVAEGVNTWMSIQATGAPNPCCIWSPLDPPPPYPPPPQPCQQLTYAFKNVSSTNAGVYAARVSNPAGAAESRPALLTVLPPITNLSSWWQGAQDLFVTNGRAFLAQDSSGLAILSVSNPALPAVLGGYNTPGQATAVVVDGDRAYVADGTAGLQIIGVTNPFSPVLLGSYDPPYSISEIAVRSNLAYLAGGKSGLHILDVSIPAAPAMVATFKSNFSADHVKVAGDYAYVSSRYSEALPGTNVAGLFVINIADPPHPFEEGRLSLGIARFAVQNQTVFGVTGSSLQIISVSNPAQPAVIGKFDYYYRPGATNLPPWPQSAVVASDVHVINHLSFVGGYSGGESRLYVVDMRDPAEPVPVGYYTNSGERYILSAADNLVYFAGLDAPLDIIQTPFSTAPDPVPTLSLEAAPDMQLGIQGRRGRNYDLETAPAPSGLPWQTVQTLLLTNESATLPISPSASNTFFRLKQLD